MISPVVSWILPSDISSGLILHAIFTFECLLSHHLHDYADCVAILFGARANICLLNPIEIRATKNLLLPDLQLEVLAKLVRFNTDNIFDVNQVKHYVFELLVLKGLIWKLKLYSLKIIKKI